MANEHVNHVVVNGQSVLDLRGDTVTADKVLRGFTAHDKSGAPITGTYEGGGGEPTHPVSAGVEFIDYDGTLVASWPTAEVASKTALPDNPDHSSDIQWGGHTIALTSQGWNFTLADIKSFASDYPDGVLTVGQMYKTTDNKLHLCVRLPEGRLNPASWFSFTGTATIDWGDGTAPVTAVSNTDNAHAYATSGDYDVAISVSEGSTLDIRGYSYCFLFKQPTGQSNDYGDVYRNCIKHIYLTIAITSIETYAFYNCSSLASVTIPNSVTSISAFSFQNCRSLTSVTAPNSVTNIGSYAFYDCSSLSSIAIPDGVTSISSYAFYNCYSLSSIAIPDGVTSIESQTFYYCRSLSNVTIPNSVTRIWGTVFAECSSLTSIVIPDSVTNIGNETFLECRALSSIVIPDSVTSIETSAFQGCSSLASITIPNSVTSIGADAFESCYSLASIVIPDSVTSIGNSAFLSCYSLTSIIIPDGVTSISNYTFNNCPILTNITIPDGITSIGESSFRHCRALSNITIPDGVTNIKREAFEDCHSLASVTIPNSVTSIGALTFYNCYGLGYIRFESETPPTVAGSSTWSNIPSDCVIYVPAASLDTYKTATNYPSPTTYTYVGY